MKICHIFDLDTILILEQKVWIVSKDNPAQPIIRIDESEFNLIKSGIYKSQNNKLEFSGKTYWLPTKLMNTLKVKVKNLGTDLTTLAVSMQEFLNKDIIDEKDFKINFDVISHIKNTLDHVYIISAKRTL